MEQPDPTLEHDCLTLEHPHETREQADLTREHDSLTRELGDATGGEAEAARALPDAIGVAAGSTISATDGLTVAPAVSLRLPQRGYGTQPKVAESSRLPWVWTDKSNNPEGVVARRHDGLEPLQGSEFVRRMTQGRRRAAPPTLG